MLQSKLDSVSTHLHKVFLVHKAIWLAEYINFTTYKLAEWFLCASVCVHPEQQGVLKTFFPEKCPLKQIYL